MSSRNSRLGAFGSVANLGNINLGDISLGEIIGRELLASEKPFGKLADFNNSVKRNRVNLNDFRRNDFLIFILEFFFNSAVLRLADCLAENMLALFGGYTADLFCFKLDFDNVARNGVLFKSLSLLNRHILVGVKHLCNNILSDKNSDCFFLRVDFTENYILIIIVPFYRGYYCSLNSLEQSVLRNIFFFAEKSDRLKKFAVVHFLTIPFVKRRNHQVLYSLFLSFQNSLHCRRQA